MLVSIITPTRDRSHTFVPILLKSILCQDIPKDWQIEWVLCDDGSEEAEYKNLQNILLTSGLKHTLIRHKETLGPAPSRNDAFQASNGEYVLDVDDDDVLTKSSVMLRVNHLLDTGAKWSFTDAYVIDENGVAQPHKDLVQDWDHNNKSAGDLVSMLLNNQAWYWASTRTYKRESLYKNGRFLSWDPEYIVAQDLDHWVLLTKEIGPPVHLNESTVHWREKQNSHGVNGKNSGLQAKMIDLIKQKWEGKD